MKERRPTIIKKFPILQGKAYVVELPEDAELIGRMDDEYWSYYSKSDGWGKFPIIGRWQIVGRLSEVTEADVKEIVDFFTTDDDLGNEDVFRDYLNKSFHDTAIKSLESAILAEGYHLDLNPLGSVPKCGCHGPSDLGACDGCDEFEEVESRVLSRERTLILKKI